MVEVEYGKDGSITGLTGLMTIRKMNENVYVQFPKEFFTKGRLGWLPGNKVKVNLKLTAKKPKVAIEEPEKIELQENKKIGVAMAETMRKQVAGASS